MVMNFLNTWNNEIQRVMAHPIKRRIIECLEKENLSFTELLSKIGERNHGKFCHHLRMLKGFVELEHLKKKYRLTNRGRLLATCIQDFRFITSAGERLARYVQSLRFGDHAVCLYDTEDFKRKISFPFLKAGLSKGEAVVYLLPEHKIDSEFREIQRYGVDFEYLPREGFTFMSTYEWYLKKGEARAKTINANWLELIREKKKAGFTGVRAAGEMTDFFDYAKTKELFEYEESLGRQLAFDFCGLCLYERNRLVEDQFIRACNYHGHLISKGIVGKTI